MQTGSSGTLIGWISGQTTYVSLWDRMEGALLWTCYGLGHTCTVPVLVSYVFLLYRTVRVRRLRGRSKVQMCRQLAITHPRPIPLHPTLQVDSEQDGLKNRHDNCVSELVSTAFLKNVQGQPTHARACDV
jgi:hypothetical protein